MEDDELTQLTQGVVDPRREGKNNSGLCVEDIADVICILHACSPAAYKVVAETAQRTPQHVLQNLDHPKYDFKVSPDLAEEQETFIVDKTQKEPLGNVTDLALRFSSDLMQPAMGYMFGRNPNQCDVVVTGDAHKRVSNTHFCIYFNESGVLMLRDMSTNGTVVDAALLKHKAGHENSQTHMLDNGSIIQVLSPNQADIIKFIVRVPSREGYETEYERRLQTFMYRCAVAQNELRRMGQGDNHRAAQIPVSAQPIHVKNTSMHNRFGMHWSGAPKYNVVGLIGKGAFASVYQLATKSNGALYAAKELEKRKFIKNGILDRKLDNEMNIMRSISHPNIVQYVDYQDVAAHLYIIMEFLPYGDLQQYLTGAGLAIGTRPLPEKMAKRMAEQVLSALDYLHIRMITHRDIKPDNILIADLGEDTFTVKLSDFGLSKVVKDNDTFLKTFCGTLLYCAPEVFPFHGEKENATGTKRARRSAPQANSRSYSQAVDVWSFGAVLWYALCLSPPFEGVADKTGRAMFEKIMMTPLEVAELVHAGVSGDAVALLVEMMNLDPLQRPSPRECLHHRWFGNRGPAPPRTETAGLGAIAEEEGSIEPDLSQLRLHEHQFTGEQSELSLDSSDLEFFQSKRFKSNAMDYRDQESVLLSSGEVVPGHIPAPPNEQADHAAVAPKPPKLFGEISRSNLHAVDPALDQVLNEGRARSEPQHDEDGSDEHNAQQVSPHAPSASSSLLATEAGVRDMHMDSPFSNGPRHAHADSASSSSPQRPRTGTGTPGSNADATPKAAKAHTKRPFDRQIRLPLTASYYYDPSDITTHNLEYASKVSGHDFLKDPRYMGNDDVSTVPIQAMPTQTGSSAQSAPSTEVSAGVPSPAAPIDSPRSNHASCFGRLVSTQDSFAAITLEIHGRRMSWGRAPSNTIVYPHTDDTRIPKHALTVYFHAQGIDSLAASADFTGLPALHSAIITYASAGIFINGVALHKGDEAAQRIHVGRLYTGDLITVYDSRSLREPGLTFICEFFCGEGKARRPPHLPRFVIEMAPMGPHQPGGSKGKVSGKESAGTVVTPAAAATA